MILKIFQNFKKGFTIIELLIAITVLIIGIVATLCMFPISIQVEKYSQQVSTAVQLAQEKTEETVSKAYNNITVGTTTESQLPAPFQKYSRQIIINYVDTNFNPTTTDTGLKKIKTKVTFENPLGFDKNIEISTLVANK